MPRKLTPSLQEWVRQRAAYLCEYCHTNERWQYVRFTIDHILPIAEGGTDDPANLALACFHCNRRKSNKRTAFDEATDQLVALFNPRAQEWLEHFMWSSNGLLIVPRTATGRITVGLLELNRERIHSIRSADVAVGRHPPLQDSIDVELRR